MFRNMAPFSLVRGYQLCVGAYCNSPCSWILIPEGRGNTFLRSVGPHLTAVRGNDIEYRDRVIDKWCRRFDRKWLHSSRMTLSTAQDTVRSVVRLLKTVYKQVVRISNILFSP
jgi:hypothetical protein